MDKIQDVVRSFDGCGNIETWLKKLKLEAKLKEVKKLDIFLSCSWMVTHFLFMMNCLRHQRTASKRLSRHCLTRLHKTDTVPMTVSDSEAGLYEEQ